MMYTLYKNCCAFG